MNAPTPLARYLICLVGEQRIDKLWQKASLSCKSLLERLYALPDRIADTLIAMTLQALG